MTTFGGVFSSLLLLTAEAFQHHRLPAFGSAAVPPRGDAWFAATLEEPDIKEVVAANTGVNEACFVDDDGDESRCVEFPPALTAPQRVIRALTFYSKVLPVLGAYKLAQIKLERKADAGMAATADEEAAIWSDLDEWGSTRIAETIKELRGFYVKTGQVISTRVDLFPEAYTSKLAMLQDSLEPMDADLVEAIVRQELLEGEPLSELFSSFDREPLGAASIAQVHKATLLNGREVAIKVQRPNVVPMLLGDISNLKSFALKLRDSLPVDYYTVFCELGRALEYELDFLHEAQAADKIHAAVTHTIAGESTRASVTIPRSIPGLVSRRVLVMDFIPGTPLSRLREEMDARGLKSDGPESQLLGQKLLRSLTEAYGRMIFGTGFIHGDPHPGNIFVMPGGEISLIDCGQVKQITGAFRIKLAKVVILVAEYLRAAGVVGRSDRGGAPVCDDVKCRAIVPDLAAAVREFGVTFAEDVPDEDECAAAVALLLFGTPDVALPGGYSHVELSNKSPIKQVLQFPQELVMLGRATVLIKGIASRLNIKWALADRWATTCRDAVEKGGSAQDVPIWARDPDQGFAVGEGAGATAGSSPGEGSALANGQRTRFTEVRGAFRRTRGVAKDWALSRGKMVATGVYERLPARAQAPIKARLLKAATKALEDDGEI